MKEYLDIVNEYGEPTGETVERSIAHLEGIPHRTSHLWVVRRKNGGIEILLQKRSFNKSFPGCYDISSAGHIPAGDEFIPSAIRELKEEVRLNAVEWNYNASIYFEKTNTLIHNFVVVSDSENFKIKKNEVDKAQWFTVSEAKEYVKPNSLAKTFLLKALRDNGFADD